MSTKDDLEIAKRRVIDARRVVTLQEQLVADLKAKGQDIRVAEQTLKLLQRSLALFETSYERALTEQAQAPRLWTLDAS